MKQNTAKIAAKSKRQPQEVVTFQDNFRLYKQGKQKQSSLSIPVILTAGLKAYLEKKISGICQGGMCCPCKEAY